MLWEESSARKIIKPYHKRLIAPPPVDSKRPHRWEDAVQGFCQHVEGKSLSVMLNVVLSQDFSKMPESVKLRRFIVLREGVSKPITSDYPELLNAE